MNIDLLTKLVRLANNNPNDNEANLAARRACKLIEEGKFDFGINSSKPTTKPPQPAVNQQRPYDPMEMFRQYAREARQQYGPPYTQYNPYTEPAPKCKNCGAELKQQWVLNEVYCEKCKVKKAEEESKQYKSYEYDFSNIKFDTSWFDEGYKSNQKPKPNPTENVTVKCLFCKQDFKRKEFRSDFICHQCYVKRNKSEKPPIKDDTTRTYYKAVFCFACGHGFTVTYTELTRDIVGQVSGNCEKCKASYIRTVT